MQTFLDDIANELLKSGSNDFSGHCIVLPNRRAGVFLRQSISSLSTKAIWAPTIMSIEDFVFDLSPYVKADQSTLLFAFYEIYKEKAKDPQTIDLFANWAPVFLSDINELDLNLLDAEDVFAQMHCIERIKKWNPSTGEATDFQKKHLDFVEQFYPFYQSIHDFLKSKELGYQGMAFRYVAENIESVMKSAAWKEVWFAGFNALTISEERIFQSWQNAGNGRLFWDVDQYYINDPVHEAGHYFRRYRDGSSDLKLDKDFKWLGNRLSEQPKQIDVVAVQRGMAQAKIAGAIINDRLSDGNQDLTNTAVVLNDEMLLMPLLGALPVELSGINITMGYGLENSQSAVFVEHLFKLYARTSNNGGFYHELVAAIVNDPFFQLVTRESSSKTLPSKVYYSLDDLELSEVHNLVFNYSWCSVLGFLNNLKNLIDSIGPRFSEDSLEPEFLFLIEKQIQRLLDLTDEFGAIDSVKTLHTFWRQLMRNQQLDFVGEPLTGLQIMGMLETRNLDFEEVIMLGVNEGNLPSTSHASSYFTFDVRRAYGLACQNERDAVTAYHFYRLLQRAKRVTLIYDEDTDSLGGGELSRYVKQLKLEKQRNVELKEQQAQFSIPKATSAPDLSIAKGPYELEQLYRLSESGFSPSALNTFRDCPLRYYLRYIAGVKEQKEFTGDLDASTLGNAVHNALEEIYQDLIGKEISIEALKEKRKTIREIVRKSVLDQLEDQDDLLGSNLLSYEVGCTYVQKVIDHDLKTIQQGESIKIIGLETELSRTIEIGLAEGVKHVRLKGTADRIDQLEDGTIRLIDYKTGVFDKTLNVKSREDFEKNNSNVAFQLLMYMFLGAGKFPVEQLKPMGFFLRANQIERDVSITEDKNILTGKDAVDYAESLVKDTLFQLFDTTLPFEPAEDEKKCKHSDFTGLCERL
jgi:hypothetical protein